MNENNLKTYGSMGLHFINGTIRQYRTIVATTDDTRASELVGDSLWGVRFYWFELEDEDEVGLTMKHPGVVYVKRDGKYSPLTDYAGKQ